MRAGTDPWFGQIICTSSSCILQASSHYMLRSTSTLGHKTRRQTFLSTLLMSPLVPAAAHADRISAKTPPCLHFLQLHVLRTTYAPQSAPLLPIDFDLGPDDVDCCAIALLPESIGSSGLWWFCHCRFGSCPGKLEHRPQPTHLASWHWLVPYTRAGLHRTTGGFALYLRVQRKYALKFA